MGHGITGRIKEISKAVVKQLMNTLRMAFMAILVVAAILALSYWLCQCHIICNNQDIGC